MEEDRALIKQTLLLRGSHTPETATEDWTMAEPAVPDARVMLRQKKAQLAAAREAAAALASAFCIDLPIS
jgi:hypothetical protein